MTQREKAIAFGVTIVVLWGVAIGMCMMGYTAGLWLSIVPVILVGFMHP